MSNEYFLEPDKFLNWVTELSKELESPFINFIDLQTFVNRIKKEGSSIIKIEKKKKFNDLKENEKYKQLYNYFNQLNIKSIIGVGGTKPINITGEGNIGSPEERNIINVLEKKVAARWWHLWGGRRRNPVRKSRKSRRKSRKTKRKRRKSRKTKKRRRRRR
tara:strand:+ start:79 stop:561 length:483 start_codon:yes stop_codon:yes gene_type:complete